MADKSQAVQVDGLKEFRKQLRELGNKDVNRELKDTHKAIAELVIARAKKKASTPLERRAAGTLKSARAVAAASVNLGGSRFPAALGAEFGAAQNRPRNTSRGTVLGWNQFKAWKGSGDNAGYFLYPSIRKSRKEIAKKYVAALEVLDAKAFPD